jgi:hypothetical protein
MRQWAAEPGWDPGAELVRELEPGIDPAPDPDPVPPGRNERTDDDGHSPRRVLGRDSLIILAGVLVAVLVAQFMPRSEGVATGSATPIPSGDVITGSLPPPVSLPPGATFGPIVDPSLGLDASPTPIPVITMGPTPSPSPEPSPSPSPKASVRPSGSPKASLKPSATPSKTPSPAPPTPSPTPVITTPPAPVAAFACTPIAGLQLDCSSTSTNATSWSWDWGDSSQNTGATPPVHIYASDLSPVTVTLSVSGPGGNDLVSHPYTLIP